MRTVSPNLFFVFVTILVISFFHDMQAQERTFNYGLELQGTAGTGEYVPFWLYSNNHGIVDINSPGGNTVLNFKKNLMNERSGFDYGFGTTLVSRYSKDRTVFFSQLYGAISYGAFQLKGGRYYEQLGTVDASLSMGSLAISPNATPLPKITFGIPEYTDVPFTQGFVELKGEIAHGWFEEDREIQNPWLHQKYAYLRFGGDFAFRPYIGLTDQATWAGEAENEGDLDDSFSDFMRVLLGRSAEGDGQTNGEAAFKLGDHRGIWDIGFDLRLGGLNLQAYRHQIYNDKDGLKFQTPDGLTGLSVELPAEKQQFVTGLLWEYLYTKNQSGPIPPPGLARDGAGGRDSYYNNYLYRTGWTYEGLNIGNPLFLNAYNPQINIVSNDQADPAMRYGIVNNRIVAHHVGIEGKLSETVRYKLMGTWSRNYGLYDDADLFEEEGLETDFFDNPEQWSFLAEFSYRPFEALRLNASLAGDTGELYEDRIGIMLGIELLGTSPF